MDWSEGELKERHFEILPQLLTAVNTRQNASKALGIVFSSIVQMVRVDCLEEVVFSEFCHLCADYYLDIICSIEKSVSGCGEEKEASGRLETLIETCLEVLHGLWSCTEYLITVAGELRMTGIRSLASGTLVVVEGTYRHCQDSSSTYGPLFGSVSALLGGMFKKSFALHSNLLRLIEEVLSGMEEEMEEKSQEELEILGQVVDKSALLCDLVSGVDRNATIGPWKFIFRIHSNFKLESLVDTHAIVAILMRQISSMLQEIQKMETSSSKSEEENRSVRSEANRTAKFLEFLFRILGLLVEAWRSSVVAALTEGLMDFVAGVKEISILGIRDDQYGDEALVHDLRRDLSVSSESLLVVMAAEGGGRFIDRISSDDGVDDGTVEGIKEAFKRLLILLVILRSADSINIAGWSNDVSQTNEMLTDCTLIRLAFKRLRQCGILMIEPLYASHCSESHRTDKSLSLYEEALRSICMYVVRSHERHLKDVEEILLENLLSPHAFNSLMACDIWCYLFRISPEKVRWQHYSTLVTLFEKVRSVQEKLDRSCKGTEKGSRRTADRTGRLLGWTIGRMYHFLPVNQQVAIFDSHPVMWTVAVHPKSPEMMAKMIRAIGDVVGNVARSLDLLTMNKLKKDLISLLGHLRTLANLDECFNVVDGNSLLDLPRLLEKVVTMMLYNIGSDFKVAGKVVLAALDICSRLFDVALYRPLLTRSCYEGLLNMVKLVSKGIVDRRSSDRNKRRLCLILSSFVRLLAKYKFNLQDKALVEDLLRSTADLSSCSTASGCPFVREHLLQAFSDFLRLTPNQEIPLLIGRSSTEGGLAVTRFVRKTISEQSSPGGFREDLFLENFKSMKVDGGGGCEDDDDDADDDGGDVDDQKAGCEVAPAPNRTNDLLSTLERALESLATERVLDDAQRGRLRNIKMAVERLL